MPHTRDHDRIIEAVRRHWGFDTLRPLQGEAIAATLARRDSLVVMPTGGGKSLCYQVPPLLTGRLCVVVSPLIALMRDQVDGLRLAGYPAAAVHGNLTADERAAIRAQITRGELRLLLVAPERLLAPEFLGWLKRLGADDPRRAVESIAIDEAHCISQWGHDFRPEYRRLAELREHFPSAAFHAYTATATPRVREDIVAQLRLENPAVLVGRFDRPNLTYRILPRVRLVDQVVEALKRHEGRAGIVYCISRKDTESLADALRQSGVDARAYHAGMEAGDRTAISSDFRAERLDVVVATVAFGMGIDRGDVRCVVHAAMPKTVEHYQQETGRAGRDGLPAECVLFYSAADGARWRRLIDQSANDSDAAVPAEVIEAQLRLLDHMQRLCSSARCRHRALSEYFGQEYGASDCAACDFCLHELQDVPDSTDIARKILSCVARVREQYGAAHVVDVLRGRSTARILERRHNELSTFGLLAEKPKESLMSYINQLIDAGVLGRAPGEFPTLHLTGASAAVLRNQSEVTLAEPKVVHTPVSSRRTAAGADSGPPLTPDELRLFEALRALRRKVADELGVPPYVVFGDITLEEMARVRPSGPDTLKGVRGVGQNKLAQFGERFIEAIASYCREHGLALDAAQGTRQRADKRRPPGRSAQTVERIKRAASLYAQGESIEGVSASMGISPSLAATYLADYVEAARPASIAPWVDDETCAAVRDAAAEVGTALLRPIYDRLGARVSYDVIKVVLRHLETTALP